MRLIQMLFLICSICFVTCGKKNTTNITHKMQTVDEAVKQSMFQIAYMYESTAPYYVVATVKNKNTGEIKEVCTEAPFLEGSLSREFERDYGYNFRLDSTITRTFELSKESVL